MIKDFYEAMATPEESTLLSGRDSEGQLARVQLVRELTKLLAKRLKYQWLSTTGTAPAQLGPSSTVSRSLIVDNVRKSKLIVDNSTFQRWRNEGAPERPRPRAEKRREEEDDERVSERVAKSPRGKGPAAAAAAAAAAEESEEEESKEEESEEEESEAEESEAEEIEDAPGSAAAPLEV